jgi:antitoxin (DNA-binding transcriptional repressor) of toxin-antitoxin stability system
MSHAEYPVDILDREGRIIGQKPRRAVDKRADIFNGVHAVLITPKGELVVSLIPQREELPNRYAGMLGSTMATIRRHGETAEEAARRGLRTELLMKDDNLKLQPVHDGMVMLEDGTRNHLTAYALTSERPELYRLFNIGELMLITPDGVDVAMTVNAKQFAPTFKAIWPGLREICLNKGDEHDRTS